MTLPKGVDEIVDNWNGSFRLTKRGLMTLTKHRQVKVALGIAESRAQSGDDEDDLNPDHEVGVITEEAKPELKRPAMFKVMLLNDDYTPMEFVVHILEKFFSMNREKATQIMLVVHTEGAAVVGIYPRDIAETKSE